MTAKWFAVGFLLGLAIAHLTRDRGPPDWADQIQGALDELLRAVEQLTTLVTASQRLAEEELMTLLELKAKVEAEGTVVASAVTLLGGLSQQLRDALATGDTAAIQAIADDVDAQREALAAAVAANTIAEPAPTTGGAEQTQQSL